ncbi:hypothetical protein BC830DRAFT_240928 [Chytriomyces sp. MP71]|nr:hypothetical protein BC830DRAFT_240928 [Chytriomyces sp. MP71]
MQEHFCAYQGDSILQQGKMYLSPNFFCFYANIFGKVTSFEFPIQDIVLIERAKTAYIIPNAIIIATLSKAYFFTSFVNRENTVMNMEYLISRHRQTAHQDQPLPSSQVLLAANVSSSYSNKDDAGPVISKPIQRSLWEDTSSGFEARSHKPAARRGRPDAPKLFQTSTDPMQTKLLAFISIMAMSILICMMLALGSTLVLWKIRTVIGRMEVVALAL